MVTFREIKTFPFVRFSPPKPRLWGGLCPTLEKAKDFLHKSRNHSEMATFGRQNVEVHSDFCCFFPLQTKNLEGEVNSSDRYGATQKGLNRLEKPRNGNLMKFNAGECQMGWNNPVHWHGLGFTGWHTMLQSRMWQSWQRPSCPRVSS